MKAQKIIELLKDYSKESAENFANYIVRLETEKDKKTGKLKNPWMNGRTEDNMAELFRRVYKDGLIFDGIHITLQATGISYDYIAYKNKMLLIYPESKMDIALVYDGDTFECSNDLGNYAYRHVIKEPFLRNEKNIIGGYCVIKNKRGEFLTLLNKNDFEKHRKTAKTDYIWQQWFAEMCMKTLIKKAVKQHFADIYENIEVIDNTNYSVDDDIVDIELLDKQKIEKIETIDELKNFYEKNKGKGKAFDAYVAKRKTEISSNATRNA